MDDLGVGPRVKKIRYARGMTQQQMADGMHKTLGWVKAFEAGERQADPRFSLLRQLASVLMVPMHALVDEEEPLETTSVEDVRGALLAPVPQSDPGAVDLPRETAYGYAAFQAGAWWDIVVRLPRLINGARAAEGGMGDEPALRQLADVCHLTAITLTKLGDGPGGWAAGDEAVRRAEESGNALEVAMCGQSAVAAATAAGRPDVGLDVAHRVIESVGGELTGCGEEGISAIGLVYLKAAYAAAAQRDADAAALMIEEGKRAATLVAPDANHLLTSFNTTGTLIYEASILGDLGEYERALDVALRIDPVAFAGLSRERRVHHLVDTARSAQGAGRPDNALSLLLQAERDDPQNIRTWALSRSVIIALLASGRQPADGRGLHGLARRAGVAG